MKTEQEIKEAIKTQRELCKERMSPAFAPSDGFCYSCRKNIYQDYGDRKGRTGKELVTGCPHCNISYLD